MIGKIATLSLFGIYAHTVTVEADIFSGLPYFGIVGLAEMEVKEARERIRSAIRHSGYTFPMHRIIINLAPAGLRKESNSFDLPMACSILVACGVIKPGILEKYFILGELSLTGEVRPVRGIVSFLIEAKKQGRIVMLPRGNEAEAQSIGFENYIPIDHLQDIVHFSESRKEPKKGVVQDIIETNLVVIDFSEISGQSESKRALEIAAAGGHNIILSGSPGTGKSMLAKALPGILPDLTTEEYIEVLQIYSSSSKNIKKIITKKRPFRAVHHTATQIAVVGGGKNLSAGEVTYAHNGVLFFDELPEFRSEVLEVLREPMEERKITISRASGTMTFPSGFMFVAAQNPCPCGYYQDEQTDCSCSMAQVERYRRKISGPLLDRIDLFCKVSRVSLDEISKGNCGECSEDIRKRVATAREIQISRKEKFQIVSSSNADLSHKDLQKIVKFDEGAKGLMHEMAEKKKLSTRGYVRLMKVSLTIADLEGSEVIKKQHVLEAFRYRRE